MRKIILLFALLIVLVSTSCNPETEIALNQSYTEEIIEEITKEPTKSPESTAIEKPTETPTSDSTATPEPEIKPSLKASDIDEMLENMADGTEIKEAPVLDISDCYLGNGVPEDFSLRDFAVVDEEGNVYYTDFYNIYIIDTESQETKIILANSDIEEKFDFGLKYSQVLPSSVYYKDGKLYTYITVEYEPYKYKNFMVDIFGEKVLYGTTEEINFSYDSRVIRSYYDDEIKSQIYNQYTLRGNADRNMFDISAGYSHISLKYVSDKYLFCIGNKFSWDEAYQYLDFSHLLIIDKDTMKTTEVIKDRELNLVDIVILMCKDEWMLFYDKNEEAIMIYNIKKGEIKTYWKFEGTSTYIGYNPYEYCVYIRKSTGYAHLENTFTPGYPHDYFEECISEKELPNAMEIFIKYNLLTLEEEVMNTVKSTDYMSRYLCFNSIKESIVGDYLFVYSSVMEESYISLSYEQKFKLGEEIDYDTWRN